MEIQNFTGIEAYEDNLTERMNPKILMNPYFLNDTPVFKRPGLVSKENCKPIKFLEHGEIKI